MFIFILIIFFAFQGKIFQGKIILGNPVCIALIAVPLIIQTFLIFIIAYSWAKVWKLLHSIAAPGEMIGGSNFFELAVVVEIL